MEKTDQIKVVFRKQQSLASFFIWNLTQALHSSVDVSFSHKETKDAFNIEIEIPDQPKIFGELTAATIIANHAEDESVFIYKSHF